MELVKIEKIFEELWEHDKSQQKKFRPYDTNYQKVTFWIMVLCFVAALIVAASTKIQLFYWQKPIALILVILCQLSALAYEASFILLGAKVLKEPTKHFLEPITKTSAIDYSLATSFCRFDISHLEYANRRINLEIDQMKKRIALLVGAIEKVGIVPVTITWAFAVYKYVSKDELKFSQIDFMVYGLLKLYILAISMIFFVHKLERYSLLIETAASLKHSEANHAAGPFKPVIS